MYATQSNQMQDHPVKTFISILAGLAAGSHSLLHANLVHLTMLDMQAALDLIIACGKAFLVGGSAWIGQTFAVSCRRKIIHWWKNRKNKKLNL